MVVEKLCIDCREVLPADSFYRHGLKKDGLGTYCRECHKARDKKMREHRKRDAKERRDRNPELRCPTCGKTKPNSEFNLHTGSATGFASTCKGCRRLTLVRQKYGVSAEVYEEMMRRQHGLCAICGQQDRGFYRGTRKRLAVDHDHTTGFVRGLLCQDCNIMLGHGKHDTNVFLSAVEYVKRARALMLKSDIPLSWM